MDYESYQLEDFVEDPSFRAWVRKSDSQHVAFWDAWLLQHPEKLPLAEAAAEIVRGLLFDKAIFDSRKTREDWQKLETNIREQQWAQPLARTATIRSIYVVRAIAAGVALVMVAAATVWWMRNVRDNYYTTDYGQKKEVVLPDGSRVTLNAQSSLRVPSQWEAQPVREVWLTGEAFFEVSKQLRKEGYAKFIVHTEKLDVEVLGTAFNVKQRESQTLVTLESGKIRLDMHHEALPDLVMKPGEQVEYAGQAAVVVHSVEPQQYSAWKQDQLILDNKTLGEVAATIEETFGKEVVFQDPAMAAIKLSGTFPLYDMPKLFKALSITTQLEITYTDKQVLFRPYRSDSSTQ